MEFMFSKWQFEAFNFIKFKNEILRNYFFKILPRFLMVASEQEDIKGFHCIPKLECSHLKSRQNLGNNSG